MKVTRNIFSLIVMLCLNLGVFAQATIQKIKINGLLEEWPNLQNNKSTGTFYQFYSDQKNFYIALRFTDDTYIKKVIAGGLTLSINTEGKKNVKDAYQITIAPVEDYRTTRQFTSTPIKIDSATQAHRKEVLTKMKELQLVGFTEIPDSIISIYNTYGIKISAKADDKGSLGYEISIPLEQLKMTADKKSDIAINVQFNAVNFRSNRTANASAGGGNMARIGGNSGGGNGGGGNRNSGGGFGGGGNRTGGGSGGSSGYGDIQLLTSANDFWDKYKTQ